MSVPTVGKKPKTATCAIYVGKRQAHLMSLEMFGGPLDGTTITQNILRLLSNGDGVLQILDESNLTVYYYDIDEQMQTCTYKGTKPLIDGEK